MTLNIYGVNYYEILLLTDQALRLADEYIQRGAIPASEKEDAWHISVATVNKIESLVSWNFKHIVSINPIRKIHEINQKNGHPSSDAKSSLHFLFFNREVWIIDN